MDKNITFRAWLEALAAPVAPVAGGTNPAQAAAQNLKLRGAKADATRAAATALQRGGNATQAAKQAVMRQVQLGRLDIKDLPKVMPE